MENASFPVFHFHENGMEYEKEHLTKCTGDE